MPNSGYISTVTEETMPLIHRHKHTEHKGRFYDLKTGKPYDIWVCECGDEKVVWA